MMDAAAELTPFETIDVEPMLQERLQYIAEADPVGSIPPPATMKGRVKTGLAKIAGGQPGILLDKMGERLAYERSGVRLYDALITKYQALSRTAEASDGDGALAGATGDATGESAAQTLTRIRNEELAHFKLLRDAITQLGGDPTSQTPCADVAATASMGFMQVLTDPRTTLAQCLNAMLAVELADHAGWELLMRLADDAGETELSGRLADALGEEQEHLTIVRGWLESLLTDGSGTKAV
jgi:rubrerythrin